jgi:HEAT repeats
MNCERAIETYLAMLAGEGDATQEAAWHEHRAACPTCQETSESMSMLWSELDDEPPQPSEALQQRVEALVEAYRQGRHDAAGRGSWTERVRGWLGLSGAAGWRPAWGLALLLVGLGLGSLWARGMSHSEVDALRREVQSTRSLVALSLLQQRSPSDRLQGVAWSARSGESDPEVIAALVATLQDDPNVGVRLATVDALGESLGMPRVLEAFLTAVTHDDSPLVQIALIDVLARSRDSRVPQAFQHLVDNPRTDETVRVRARWALGQLHS